MKKNRILSCIISTVMCIGMLPISTAYADNTFYISDNFDSNISSWSQRCCKTGLSGRFPHSGTDAFLISERTANWAGATKTLDVSEYKAGNTYSIGLFLTFLDSESYNEKFNISLQYTDASSQIHYVSVASKTIYKGYYSFIGNSSFTIPTDVASDMFLVIDSGTSTMNYYIDDFYIAEKGYLPDNYKSSFDDLQSGDVNKDGKVNVIDLAILKSNNTSLLSDSISYSLSDINSNSSFEENDMCQLKNYLLKKQNCFTTKETYDSREKVATDSLNQIISNLKSVEPKYLDEKYDDTDYGTLKKYTYYSNTKQRNTNVNVLLPAGYDESKEYPVLYVLHGYGGNEDSLLDSGDSTLHLINIYGNMLKEGTAEPMIIVFPDVYSDSASAKCTGDYHADASSYDKFINELPNDLIPFIESNFSVKTGRENRAITGYSMGARESLYIGIMRSDLFAYVGSVCAAPGITPVPNSAYHPGIISDEEFTTTDDMKLVLISGALNDNTVSNQPETYFNRLVANGVTCILDIIPTGDHGGNSIRPHFYNFVKNLFKD